MSPAVHLLIWGSPRQSVSEKVSLLNLLLSTGYSTTLDPATTINNGTAIIHNLIGNSTIFIIMSRINTSFNSPTHSRKDVRWEEILDQKDHKRVSEGNRTALLHERLENLRSLKYELAQDDWKYETKASKNNATRF